jgi:hypothetical protein
MGGFGSGGWNRTGRFTTSDALRLDVNSLNKSGVLAPGRCSTSTWTQDGETIGNVKIRATDAGVILLYRSRKRDEDWGDHRDRVRVSWEPGRFGGQRPYFHCPDCARRVLHLYGFSRYLCRHCHGLCYPSQRERDSDRAQRRANRIRVELGGEPGWHNIPSRPKGMHRRTYDRLINKIIVADAVTDDGAIRLLARLQASVQEGARGFWS